MPSHYLVNVLVLGLLLAGAVIGWRIRRHRWWIRALRQLWRRRPFCVVAISAYVLVALLDSVAWVGGDSGTDLVARYEARTALSRMLGEHQEHGYSAPLAQGEFYGGAPLVYPGRHLLGTDRLGRDVFVQTLRGARVALLVGGLTCLLAVPLALLLGVGAGYFGQWVDRLVSFLASTLASIPNILLLIALVMALGRHTVTVCLALSLASWVDLCRIVRAETMKLRELEFIHAARALGVSEAAILWRHVLPNVSHLVLITFVLMFSRLVLSEAVLAWLGIGIEASWGQMMALAKDELSREPAIYWNVLAAGSALLGLLWAMNLLGDALRDALDPRTLRETS